MGQSSPIRRGLTPAQTQAFKISVSAACRKMTADQILDLADHLHAIIRRRSAALTPAARTPCRPCRAVAASGPIGEAVQ